MAVIWPNPASFGQIPAKSRVQLDSAGIQPILTRIRRRRLGITRFRQKISDSGTDRLPDFGDGRPLEHENQLHRLKNGRLHLPSEENDLRF
jgi:hypothetical protein